MRSGGTGAHEVIGVSTKPGLSAVARTPCSPRWVQRAREVDHPCLGRPVDRELSRRARSGDRRDVDDQAAGFTQERKRGGSHENCSTEVDVQLQVDVFRLELVDGAGDPDAGGVHEHVEPPVPLAVLVNEAAAILLLGHVSHDGMSPECLRRGFALRAGPSGECQGEAVLPQHARDRETDTRRAASDERRPVHEGIFSSRKVQRRSCRTGRRGCRKAPPLP